MLTKKRRFVYGIAAYLVCILLSARAQQEPQLGKMEIPVPQSGKVVMQDGSPPPEPVDVEAFCGAVRFPAARTDSKGGFVLGSGRSGAIDAKPQVRGVRSGAVGGGGPQMLGGCTLQARLPGYRSSSLRVGAGDFDVGYIILSPRAGVEGRTFSGTALDAPDETRKTFEKARQAIEKKRPDKAKPLLEKVVHDYPRYAAAWLELGRIHQGANDPEKARNAFEQAISADPKYILPYLNLATIYSAERNWKATAETTATIIKLDPLDYPAAYALNAKSNFRLGNATAAKIAAEKAQEIDPTAAPEMEYILGTIMAERGDIKGATEHLNNYLKLAPNAPGADIVKKQLAEYEKPGTLK